MKVPIGVFGMAIGVASYPTISRMVAAGSIVDAYGTLAHAVRLMLFVTFAAQVCLTLAGFEASYLIWGFMSHRFNAADAAATGSVLAFLCLGLSGWAAQTVISRGFYALGSTWLPTAVGTAVAFCAVPLYVLLRQQNGAIGLAIASAIAIVVYVLLLGWLQYRRFSREAAARGDSLDRVDGMLDPALRMGLACGTAIGAGFLIRLLLPGDGLPLDLSAERNPMLRRARLLPDHCTAIGDPRAGRGSGTDQTQTHASGTSAEQARPMTGLSALEGADKGSSSKGDGPSRVASSSRPRSEVLPARGLKIRYESLK
jgi:hypothetical protein